MSAKRSWDVAPSARAPRAEAARGATVSIRRSNADTGPRVPLATRRQKRRRVVGTFLALALLLLLVGVLILLWRPMFRISDVRIVGADEEAVQALVESELTGSRWYLVPRSSLFFVPQREIRAGILAQFPDIQAVSIEAEGLHTLVVHTLRRAPAFWWCGATALAGEAACYEMDSYGLVFASVPPEVRTASTSMLFLYMPLAEGVAEGESPLGKHIDNPSALPNLLRFVKALQELGVSIDSLGIRGDEADLYTPSGTRITYVLGKEEAAAVLAASSFPSLNLSDGSLIYVDLRFSGKVYLRKMGEVTPE